MYNLEEILNALLHEEPYRRLGNEYRYTCPKCQSAHKKFYVNMNTGSGYCFNCEFGVRNLVGLVQYILKCDEKDAKSWLDDNEYEDYGYDLAELDENADLYTQVSTLLIPKDETTKRKKMPTLPTNVKYLIDNFNNKEAIPYFTYLNNRGVTLEQIKKYNIGYVVNGAFKGSSDRVNNISNSIIFTTYNDLGLPIYWSSRNIYATTHSATIKSINAPAGDGEYSRQEIVFNLNNLRKSQDLFIAEGIFNVLTIKPNSKYCGVATLGKEISETQINLIVSKSNLFNNLILALDGDVKQNFIDKVVHMIEKAGLSKSRIKICYNNNVDKDFNDLGEEKALELLDNSSSLSFSKSLEKLFG